MFDSHALPVLGVGLEYWVDTRVPRTGPLQVSALFDYVELQPPHLIFDPGLIEALGATRALLHSSDLSLGSVGIPMDPEFLALTCRLLRQTGSPWFSEHISWNRFPGGDTRHFILPYLGDEVRDTIIANARMLHVRSGLPVLLENAPRTLVVDLPGDDPEDRFMRDVLEGANADLVLDIDNARATALTRGLALPDYLGSLPLERTVEIHVHDPVADRALFWTLLQEAPVRAVTLGWGAHRAQNPALVQTVRDIKASLARKSTRHLHALGALPPTDEPLYAMAPGVALTLRDGCLKVTGGEAALQLDLGLECLPLLGHFAKPATLASALLLESQAFDPQQPAREGQAPGGAQADAPPDMLRAMALLRELLTRGVLVPHGPPDTAGAMQHREPWTHWDSALDFYLATRTRKQTAFATLNEMEQTLSLKATGQAQPSAYKDYPAHPFYALPNPLEQVLPANHSAVDASGFLDVLLQRRSLRAFTAEPLLAAELSALLFYVWGATCVRPNPLGDVFLQKTAPAGGSLHGAEVYALLMHVQGYAPGLYHYSVRRHGLELLSRDNPHDWIARACGDQTWIADAAAVFLSTYKVQRLAWKYSFSRGFRAALLDTGHLGQSFALVSTWLGLAPFTTAALRDELFEEKLGLDYLAEPVLMLNGVGRPAQALLLPDRPSRQAGSATVETPRP